MSKKRVGIYIDEKVWARVKELAWRDRKSVSEYVEKLISGQEYRVALQTLVEDVIIPEKVYRDTDVI